MSCCSACQKRSPSTSPCKKKSPSPVRSARNVFPAHMWQFIASRANASTRAALARAIPGVVTRQRPPVLNRSRKMSYAVPKAGYSKLNWLNKVAPAAYRNRAWRYYIPYDAHHAYFFNNQNGPAFTFHKKTGDRRPAPTGPRGRPMAEIIDQLGLKPRRNVHTWNAYIRRVKAAHSYARGAPVRQAKVATIGNKVNRYLRGNQAAVANVSIPDLMFWARSANWMNADEQYRYRGGQWYFSSGAPLTKANILRNIKNANTYR